MTRRSLLLPLLFTPVARPQSHCPIEFKISGKENLILDITVPNMSAEDIRSVVSEAWMPPGKVVEFKRILAKAKQISLTLTSRSTCGQA